MSRKNHQVVNCRLLQTDKPFSQLKQTQKEKINEWLYQEGIPRRLSEGREGTGRKAQRQHRSYSLQKD